MNFCLWFPLLTLSKIATCGKRFPLAAIISVLKGLFIVPVGTRGLFLLEFNYGSCGDYGFYFT